MGDYAPGAGRHVAPVTGGPRMMLQLSVTMPYDKDWFEFKRFKGRRFDSQVWVPLFGLEETSLEGEQYMVGHVVEHRIAGVLAVAIEHEGTARRADATDLIGHGPSQPYVDAEGRYVRSDERVAFYNELDGIRLVVEQNVPGMDYWEVDLSQDFVLALNLKREGNAWVRIEEGREVVARMKRDASGKPRLLEAKVEHLKDFLCARKMGLVLGLFVSHTAVFEEDPDFLDWERPTVFEADEAAGWRWRGDITTVHEGGNAPFGEEMQVFQLGRTGLDPEDEAPSLGVGDGEFESAKWSVPLGQGRKAFRVSGEIWKTEWIPPAASSPRVAGDKQPSTSYFIVGGSGTRVSGDELPDSLTWLWFRPEIVNEALRYPDGFLHWLTAETGTLGFSPDCGVHFGLNDEGLIMVLAVDIERLPQWDQARWVGFNIAPAGGVSKELAASQVEGHPAATVAPETEIAAVLERVGKAIEERYGFALYSSEINQDILKKAHRYTAVDDDGVLKLAKDLTRLFADRIDSKRLQRSLRTPPAQTVGSLRALQYRLATIIPEDKAANVCAALYGIYDLRKADAHIPSSNIEEDYLRANIKRGKPPVWQGHDMLVAFVVTLHTIAQIIEHRP